MPKFFVENTPEEITVLQGQTAAHIAKSLRMKVGEEVVLCDGKGYDYGCVIEQITKTQVVVKLAFRTPSESEPQLKISLYQGVPKGDKLADVVRQCTELGVSEFHPVLMKRSIARPDEKSAARKLERLRKVAAEAAEQSRRGVIPRVFAFEGYESALQNNESEKTILFYENGGKSLKTILSTYATQQVKSIALIIGPEGGFEQSEVDFAKCCGAEVATLGKRILRTQTAPVAASAAVLYELENE